MISKEQLKHIDADDLVRLTELLQQFAEIEQIILKAYAEGRDKVTIVFKHKFVYAVLEELEDCEYTYIEERTSDLDDGLDFYEVTIK